MQSTDILKSKTTIHQVMAYNYDKNSYHLRDYGLLYVTEILTAALEN